MMFAAMVLIGLFMGLIKALAWIGIWLLVIVAPAIVWFAMAADKLIARLRPDVRFCRLRDARQNQPTEQPVGIVQKT